MTQCPEHPRTVGASTTDCAACRREAVPPTPAYLAAKAAIPRRPVVHKHPSAPVTDVTGARARIDTEQEES